MQPEEEDQKYLEIYKGVPIPLIFGTYNKEACYTYLSTYKKQLFFTNTRMDNYEVFHHKVIAYICWLEDRIKYFKTINLLKGKPNEIK